MTKKKFFEILTYVGIIVGIISAIYAIYTNWLYHERVKKADEALDKLDAQERDALIKYYENAYMRTVS